jgi:hypothetical protein
MEGIRSKVVLKKMAFDFSSRNKITATFGKLLVNMCTGKKVAKTWCRMYKNGARKLDQELDVLQMIRHHRLMVSTIAGLMN